MNLKERQNFLLIKPNSSQVIQHKHYIFYILLLYNYNVPIILIINSAIVMVGLYSL